MVELALQPKPELRKTEKLFQKNEKHNYVKQGIKNMSYHNTKTHQNHSWTWQHNNIRLDYTGHYTVYLLKFMLYISYIGSHLTSWSEMLNSTKCTFFHQ